MVSKFQTFLRNRFGLPFAVEGEEDVQSDWDVGDDIEEVKECGKIGNPVVYITPLVHNKISLLMDKYPDKEWLGYLQGESEKGVFIINNINIPKQEVTGASVEVLKFPENIKDIIGVMHSHNTMGAFFSSTDDDYINSNHSLSLVVSSKGLKGTARFKAPCGAFVRRDDIKIFVYMPKSHLVEWEKIVDENIKEKEYGYVGGTYVKGKAVGYVPPYRGDVL